MSFRERRIGGLLDSRQAATDLLKDEGKRTRNLTLDEAFVLQGTSHLLIDKEEVFGNEIAELITVSRKTIYNILTRFEEQDRIFQGEWEAREVAAGEGRPPRRLYTPTNFGHRVLELFTPKKS